MSASERVLRLAALPCPGRHGAYPGERDTIRTFFVDVTVRGALGDRDVEPIADAVRGAVATRSRALLETVAADVADAVLADARVVEIEVCVTKREPPGLGAAAEAVALTRSRGGRSPSSSPAPPGGHRARG